MEATATVTFGAPGVYDMAMTAEAGAIRHESLTNPSTVSPSPLEIEMSPWSRSHDGSAHYN